MISRPPSFSSPEIRLPVTAALVAGARGAYWLSSEGEIETLSFKAATARLASSPPPLVCHGRATARRLDCPPFSAFDVLELYAFVRPAQFCLPTPRGLAVELDIAIPTSHESEAASLFAATEVLLGELAADAKLLARDMAPVAWAMDRGGWPWGPMVLAALGAGSAPHSNAIDDGLRVWNRLKEWEDRPPPAPPSHQPVDAKEARSRLAELLGSHRERRDAQATYAGDAARAFAPCVREGEPAFVLAEAGTGIGKTLGYIAPASVWAEKNEGAVWISTFTRNLQRQLDAELDRLYPDPVEKAKRVVVRKGRENYFCILNYADVVGRAKTQAGAAVTLGLMARWAQFSRDGDMVGGDFPSWLADLRGPGLTLGLTDKRGECIFSACAHYRKCFVEHSQRRARHARIVVANHALVMIQAALGGHVGQITHNGAPSNASFDTSGLPTRYIFDEGHHLFSAADSTFSAHLSGMETADLRRWLLGAEEGSRTRSRGLKSRMEETFSDDEKISELVDAIRRAAHVLPSPGWRARLVEGNAVGAVEQFLSAVRTQVYARTQGRENYYSLETQTHPLGDGVADAALALDRALGTIEGPVRQLLKGLSDALNSNNSDADDEDNSQSRIEGLAASLERRALIPITGWRAMLMDLIASKESAIAANDDSPFVDWFDVERIDGREFDLGLHRHWLDPTEPFARALMLSAQGALVTSATLCDRVVQKDGTYSDPDWVGADAFTGAAHLPYPAVHVTHPSPFDYAKRTRVWVVGDVAKNDPAAVARAYQSLFLASGGGALGLFTAISRLRAVHGRIIGPLEDAGIPLLAQHVDAMDTGTLIDIFRAENDACLLGTDAVRDGIDVPGRSLRMIVFDRVPWPRPDILHKARQRAFGGRHYDEVQTRLKLKQAFGRLLRRADDYGVFVMLDSALPSRLTSAFPEGVAIERVSLADAVAGTRALMGELGGDA